MRFFCETFDDHVEILPTLTLGVVECDSCGEDHGLCIAIGWLVFTVGIAFITEDHQ